MPDENTIFPLSDKKTCTKCGEEKPRNETYFGPYKGRSVDGLRPLCRECRRAWDRQWQKEKRNKKPG